MSLRVTKQNDVSVYTVSGANTTPSLPDWLARKRKRSLKNDEAYMNRIELIQDFEFEEASQCIQVSEDGEYAMATGTYKPQMHIYHLPSSSLKYARHTSALNLTFLLLSSDYSKSLHLQTDRSLEFHTPMGCHYATRIPRYGRSLAYLKPQAHAIITAEGNEVFRLDMEAGRFLKPFELGGFEGKGGIVKSVETVATADGSHGLLAFGTDAGTTEFWDPRSRKRIGVLAPPPNAGYVLDTFGESHTPMITSTQFHSNGLTFATGNQAGMVTLYDLRSAAPLLSRDQGYGFPIHSLKFLSTHGTNDQKVLAADKKVIKLFDTNTGAPWVTIQPTVDLNHVTPVPNSGMIFTANEGQQMHSFLIPALGPSPWWCSHLDSQIEQLADRTVNDPDSYASATAEAAVYDNYKFLTKPEMRQLNLDHLLSSGKGAGVVRPYMHGYFVDQRLYDEARLIADPFEWERQKNKIVREKIEKERESRIRTSNRDKAAQKVKINKRLAERLEQQEQKFKRKDKLADGPAADADADTTPSVLQDPRFKGLFENPDFAVDETSSEFKLLNPSTKPSTSDTPVERKRGKTAAEQEEESTDHHSSSSDSSDEGDSDSEPEAPQHRPREKKQPEMRISTSSYRKAGHDTRGFAAVSQNEKDRRRRKEKSFGARAQTYAAKAAERGVDKIKSGTVLGEKEISFRPAPRQKKARFAAGGEEGAGEGGEKRRREGRRSASNNVVRKLGREL